MASSWQPPVGPAQLIQVEGRNTRDLTKEEEDFARAAATDCAELTKLAAPFVQEFVEAHVPPEPVPQNQAPQVPQRSFYDRYHLFKRDYLPPVILKQGLFSPTVAAEGVKASEFIWRNRNITNHDNLLSVTPAAVEILVNSLTTLFSRRLLNNRQVRREARRVRLRWNLKKRSLPPP